MTQPSRMSVTPPCESMNLLGRFGLGTVQFGMLYGRFNRVGMPFQQDVFRILERAAELGLSCIDSAHSYGNSEAVLGQCSDALRPFSVITKTPRFPEGRISGESGQMLREAFETSLLRMRLPAVDGLLIHHAPNLLADGGEVLYREMVRLKNEGFVKRIGVSAYSGDTVEQIHHEFPLDFVQLPVNLVDRRLIESGSLYRIAKAGIKIHARSAFLQGLLLADADSLPVQFKPAAQTLKTFHTACRSTGVRPAHAALHYLLGISEIEKIIIGVESLSQLEELFSNFPDKIEMNYEEFKVYRPDILNPVLWNK